MGFCKRWAMRRGEQVLHRQHPSQARTQSNKKGEVCTPCLFNYEPTYKIRLVWSETFKARGLHVRAKQMQKKDKTSKRLETSWVRS